LNTRRIELNSAELHAVLRQIGLHRIDLKQGQRQPGSRLRSLCLQLAVLQGDLRQLQGALGQVDRARLCLQAARP